MTSRDGAPVRGTDRVSDVLARDEALVEVFVRLAPHFAKLRNRAVRRVMARLVTVEQAARTANIAADELIDALNHALGLAMIPSVRDVRDVRDVRAPEEQGAAIGVERASRAHPASASVVALDVRDELRAGREPFARIMAAVGKLDDDVLHLRTTFEPVPLYEVLGKRGLVHESLAHAADDWSVWFWREHDAAPPPADQVPTENRDSASTGESAMIQLDVRGLMPPEPMLRTLAALDTLHADGELVQINDRVPQFLLPVLAERGFACEVDTSRPDGVRVRIWRAASTPTRSKL